MLVSSLDDLVNIYLQKHDELIKLTAEPKIDYDKQTQTRQVGEFVEGVDANGVQWELEISLEGHGEGANRYEGPHVTIKRWDPTSGSKGRYVTLHKIFIKGQEK